VFVRHLLRGVPLALFIFAALSSTWSVTAAVAAQDPVAAYSFDAGEGTVAEDVTGDEHDGTIEGASWFDNGRFGPALDFGGEKGECVTIPDAEDLRITEELTVEAWVKPRSPLDDDPVVYKSAYGYTGDALGIGIFNSGKPEGFLGEGEGEFESVVGPSSLEADVWTHLAFTYDGAHMRLYVNGQLSASKAQSEGAPWGEGNLVIGCNPNYPSEVFDGLIDEVRIYNRALSAGEITSDAGAGLQTPSRTPVAAYSFDAGEGETLEDLTGEHDGTIEGASWFENGKYGSALDFDGENDCVTVENAPDLQLTEELTLETWVKPEGSGKSEPVIFKETPWYFGYSLYLGIGEEGHMEGLIGEEGYVFKDTEDPEKLETGVWNHVALTFDGAHMRLYVNGGLVDTTAAEGAWSSSGPLSIGCSSEFEDNFDGLIDEVRIYNRALSAGEITSDAGAGLQTPSRTPVAAYSFDAGEGETVEDLTGEHDGAIEGASWFENGKYGSTLNFDGENDCVTVEDAPDLQLTEELTLEAWVKPKGSGASEPIIFKETPWFFGYSLYLGINEHGHMEGLIGEEGYESSVAEDPAKLETNVWSHIALTFDGSHMRLHVNGQLVDTSKAEGPWGTSGPLSIGCSEEFEDNFKGLIDEVRVYNRALSAAEISADAGAGLQTPQNTPVAAYSFDAGEGEVAEDVTANEHDGAIEGASWFENGKYGSALDFDGEEGECVTVEDAPDLQLTEELTLETWVKPEGSGKSEPVIFKETPWYFGYSLYLGIGEEGHMEGLIGEEGYVFKDTEDPEELETGVWSHVALTFDGAHMRLYVNGQLVDTTSAEGAWSSSGPLSIGCSEEFEDNFEGKIDEVRIYNRALSADELAADAGAGLQTPSRAPVAAYSFDAGEGTVADDVTGDGHDGAIAGASWFDNGRFGSALSFDGENDCVTVEDAPDLQLTEELTLEAWVKPEGSGKSEPVIFKEAPYFFGYSLYLGIGESGHMEGLIGEEGYEASVAEDPAKLETNVWSHVALTFDGSHMRLYVNGSLVDTTSAEGAWSSSGPLSIGCSSEFEDNFDGLIDEARIYNRALSAGEITADMATPIPVPPVPVTGEADAVTANEAILTGNVDPNGSETTYRFDYGTTTAYGNVVPEAEEETLDGDGEQIAEEAVAYLVPNTTYHYRIVATNSAGTVWGNDQTLTTPSSEVSPAQEAEEREEEVAFTAKFKSSPTGFVDLNWSGFPSAEEWTKIKDSGTTLLRVGIEDLHNFDQPGRRAAYDGFFLKAAENHVRPVFVLGSKHIPAGVPQSEEVKCAKEVVDRYGPNGSLWEEKGVTNAYAPSYWQVWNEPNIGVNSLRGPDGGSGVVHPQEFGDFLGQMSEGIKEAEKSAKIIVGGLLSVNTNRKGESKFTPQEFVVKMGHPKSYDVVGLHPYVFKAKYQKPKGAVGRPRNHHDVENVRMRVRGLIKKFRIALNRAEGSNETKKRIWIDELGWPVENTEEQEHPTHPPVSKEIQADLLKSTFNTIKSLPDSWTVDRVFYYDLADSPGKPNWDSNTGLLDDNLNPRPAWEAFKALAK
jgi:Concanavalin A-like lectin/glucanases superfamily